MPSMTKGTVLVASPSAMGSRPVASGSRVPPWPALAALKTRRTSPTAAVEVMPAGLSRISQPSTRSPRRLRPITLVLWAFILGAGILLQIADDGGVLQQPLDA